MTKKKHTNRGSVVKSKKKATKSQPQSRVIEKKLRLPAKLTKSIQKKADALGIPFNSMAIICLDTGLRAQP